MTEDEMHELYAVIETIGVTRRQKQIAMNRLIEKGVIEQPGPKQATITEYARVALGKVKVSW